MEPDGLRKAEDKMRRAGQHPDAVRAFRRAYEQLVSGAEALLPSAELEPVRDMPRLDDLPAAGALDGVVSIKLNGGLATTMGLGQPKSLLEAREGRTFLDLIVGQTLALRRRHGAALPLLLMDSKATRPRTLAALRRHPEVATAGLEPDFLQGMIPKLCAATVRPVAWEADPALEWCPPGHGDVYGALSRSGALGALLERGYEVAMISNSDNLGAIPDPRIAAFIEAERIPFLAEVVVGTAADRKGGHIARRRSDGRLVLRETAQTPPGEEAEFRDFERWRYYNTNNVWVSLPALAEVLERSGGFLELPLIVNRKTVDPRDPTSTPVLQLESAMGAAIETFTGARLLEVPRRRFVPVKTTDDLLLVRSDAYRISEELAVEPVRDRRGPPPYIELDRRFFGLIDDFERRFPDGSPSLVDADRLVVRGDVTFGAGVVVRGEVELEAAARATLPPGTVLQGNLRLG
jgi:UTP--glucose-1-phosphate uridylyltransferase